MANAEDYATWIVNNADKRGTPEFDTVAQAYQIAKGSKPQAEPITRGQKITQGLKDPINGMAQGLTHILPEGVVSAGNKMNNWLADKTGMVARLPDGGVDEQVRQQEKQYQAGRAAAGESGFDGWRTAGNVASPANFALGAKLPQMASLAGRIGVGVGAGGASAAMAPVTDGDFWSEKGKQAATGAAFGGTVPAAMGGLSRLVSPKASINPAIDALKREGVQPTVGQTLGGWANKFEEKMQSLPIMGDAIAAARKRGTEQLNRAAFNRALAPLGKSLPDSVPLGHDAVLYTRNTLGDAYDTLLPKLTAKADQTFTKEVGTLRHMVQGSALDPKYVKQFDKVVRDRVTSKFQGQNAMTGETAKTVMEHLRDEATRFGSSQDPDARLLGSAFKEVESSLRGLLERNNPMYAGKLKAINTGYANFKRVQKAAAGLGAEDGIFTPAQLQNAVKAADRSKDKARFSEGKALMQDLSGPGKSVMSGKVPDSGTAGRLALGAGALGTGAISPAIPAGLMGGAALYTPWAQSLLRGAVSARPQSAQAVADALKKASPLLIPGGAQMGLGLLNQ